LESGWAFFGAWPSAFDSPPPSYVTGEELWKTCGFKSKGVPPKACSQYILGVFDVMYVSDFSNKEYDDSAVCPGETVDAAIIRIVNRIRNHLRHHPKERREGAAVIVMNMLQTLYNCGPE
jgi:hypothetical protein